MIGAVENVTAPETAKLCAQYLGPGAATAELQLPAVPVQSVSDANPPARQAHLLRARAWRPAVRGRSRSPPEIPPAVSAYTGLNGDVPPPPGYGQPPAVAPRPVRARSPAGRPVTRVVPGQRRCPPRAPPAPRRCCCRCRRGHTMTGRLECVDVSAIGSAVHADGDRVRVSGRELAAAARRGGPRPRRQHLSRRIANIGTLESNSPVMIDDVVVGSVGKMTVARTGTPTSRCRCEARRRRARERGGHRRADQPAGVHAPGAGSAAGRAADGRLQPGATIALEQDVDLSLDRTDPVVAVGGRQRRRAGSDRRHHPQLQRRAVRAPGRGPRSAHPPGHASSARSISSATTSSRPSTSWTGSRRRSPASRTSSPRA